MRKRTKGETLRLLSRYADGRLAFAARSLALLGDRKVEAGAWYAPTETELLDLTRKRRIDAARRAVEGAGFRSEFGPIQVRLDEDAGGYQIREVA
jgi:hypothetical protein